MKGLVSTIDIRGQYGDTSILHPLNPKYPDIVIKKGERFHIVGKVVRKVKIY